MSPLFGRVSTDRTGVAARSRGDIQVRGLRSRSRGIGRFDRRSAPANRATIGLAPGKSRQPCRRAALPWISETALGGPARAADAFARNEVLAQAPNARHPDHLPHHGPHYTDRSEHRDRRSGDFAGRGNPAQVPSLRPNAPLESKACMGRTPRRLNAAMTKDAPPSLPFRPSQSSISLDQLRRRVRRLQSVRKYRDFRLVSPCSLIAVSITGLTASWFGGASGLPSGAWNCRLRAFGASRNVTRHSARPRSAALRPQRSSRATSKSMPTRSSRRSATFNGGGSSSSWQPSAGSVKH